MKFSSHLIFLVCQLCCALAVRDNCHQAIIYPWVFEQVIEYHHDFPTLNHLKSSTPSETQAQATKDLIFRLIPDRSSEFDVFVDPNIGPKDRDTFKLESKSNKVVITGTSGVAAAWGFYYYLTEYCGCHVSWEGDQTTLPQSLPVLPSEGVLITSNDRFRYYQNVCTVSYSFAWYKWGNWEREIDWMALNGINLPLAFNGQEAIWQKVYLKLGLTQDELDNHFGGAAFLAWSRMGNMHGWGGPLSQSSQDQQVALQHKILRRMRDLGMVPVLPSFAGHVPNAITRIYPNASVSHLPDWGGFNKTYCCTLLLDLDDPLFVKLGKAFLDEYISEFGTDHIYNTDTFNELTPKSSDPSYLAAAGKAVFNSMLASDEDAIWLMQGWLFIDTSFWHPEQAKALLTSVPQGRMIILDLFSEVMPQYPRLDSYFGQPYIWCMLHNFGGTSSMYGVIDSVNQGPSHARSLTDSTMVGIGLTPEGINQNYFMYEFMLENGWRKEARNETLWTQRYAARRYGAYHPDVDKAWQILKSGVYNCTSGFHDNGYTILISRPSLSLNYNEYWYSAEEFFQAWDLLVSASDKFSNSTLFRYDLVDISRQALEIISTTFYHEMIVSYKNKDLQSFQTNSTRFLLLLLDLDDLLATDEHFLLGRWLEAAKDLASNEDDRRLFEYNARNQLTLWGPDANILDYACKQWSGLVKGYYYPRWRLFIDELFLHWNTTFDENQFRSDVFNDVEKPFTFDRSFYPSSATGKQISVATDIHIRYRPATRLAASSFKHLRNRKVGKLRDRIRSYSMTRSSHSIL